MSVLYETTILVTFYKNKSSIEFIQIVVKLNSYRLWYQKFASILISKLVKLSELGSTLLSITNKYNLKSS